MIGNFTRENPVLILFLGLCPVLTVTTSVANAIAMSICIIFVLLGSNFFISLFRNIIPETIRIPACIVIIAFFVTLAELFFEAYLPVLFRSLGLFIPLIVVNCIILGSAGEVAGKNKLTSSIVNALGRGIGLAAGMIIIALTREILGAGTITLFPVSGFSGVIELPRASFGTMKVLVMAPGALLVTGYLLAFITWLFSKKRGSGFAGKEKVLKNNA